MLKAYLDMGGALCGEPISDLELDIRGAIGICSKISGSPGPSARCVGDFPGFPEKLKVPGHPR